MTTGRSSLFRSGDVALEIIPREMSISAMPTTTRPICLNVLSSLLRNVAVPMIRSTGMIRVRSSERIRAATAEPTSAPSNSANPSVGVI